MLTIGVDVGGTSVRSSVVDAHGHVLATVRVPTPDTAAALNTAVASTIQELSGQYPVEAAGLAVAGFVSEDRQTVRFAPHLAWRQTDVVADMRDRVGLPVVLEHDVNAAGIAEYRFGAAAGASTAVLIALGTGIGGALILNGTVYRGAYGVAPELGHLRLVPEGRPCSCGKRGCWERYCSGTALVQTLIERLAETSDETPFSARVKANPASVTGEMVADAARSGDPAARYAMRELARWLGEGLALVADLYDPEVVVIAGGVAGSSGLFLSTATAHYAQTLTGAGHRPLARVLVAELGGNAGMVGAAELARLHVLGQDANRSA